MLFLFLLRQIQARRLRAESNRGRGVFQALLCVLCPRLFYQLALAYKYHDCLAVCCYNQSVRGWC